MTAPDSAKPAPSVKPNHPAPVPVLRQPAGASNSPNPAGGEVPRESYSK
jgi:hypothetical protein